LRGFGVSAANKDRAVAPRESQVRRVGAIALAELLSGILPGLFSECRTPCGTPLRRMRFLARFFYCTPFFRSD
jgi:hypothetical protein